MKEPFKPSPNLSKEINDAIAESELQGGVFVKDLPRLTTLVVDTKNSRYILIHEAKGWVVSGGTHFPNPVPCYINGSTWGGSMLKVGFIGRGMRLELTIGGRTLTTSTIQEVTEIR